MIEWPHVWCLLAADQPPPQGNPLLTLLPPVMMAVVLYFLIVARPQKRQKQQREALLQSLKKNDRVVTIGGIIGTIAGMSKDGKDVTLKVDDNTRIRVLRSSIQGPHKETEDESK